MASIRIPTPLRPYAANNEYVEVSGDTVGGALEDLVEQYPDLGKHLFHNGQLRSFVNIFIGEEDIRFMDGVDTPIEADAELMIIPSIAGGSDAVRKVDHSALRTNQAFIISLLLIAFVLQVWHLVAFVGIVMIVGTIFPQAGLFKRVYRHILKPFNIAKPDVHIDNPEPHLFAQGVGGAFLAGSTLALILGSSVVGWVLAWIVIVLASLNLFAGWCAGCFMYYQFNRLGIPGFTQAPIITQDS